MIQRPQQRGDDDHLMKLCYGTNPKMYKPKDVFYMGGPYKPRLIMPYTLKPLYIICKGFATWLEPTAQLRIQKVTTQIWTLRPGIRHHDDS